MSGLQWLASVLPPRQYAGKKLLLSLVPFVCYYQKQTVFINAKHSPPLLLSEESPANAGASLHLVTGKPDMNDQDYSARI